MKMKKGSTATRLDGGFHRLKQAQPPQRPNGRGAGWMDTFLSSHCKTTKATTAVASGAVTDAWKGGRRSPRKPERESHASGGDVTMDSSLPVWGSLGDLDAHPRRSSTLWSRPGGAHLPEARVCIALVPARPPVMLSAAWNGFLFLLRLASAHAAPTSK